ncbi:MAG: helicase-related protein, partial [Candidatus Woesearchaeota archaeon]|nr:helicase-related protein [Candidatus Woesearchaeota archaeon]
MSLRILTSTNVPVVDIILDTLKKNKQAIVFVNTKRSAEKEAEEIAKQLSAVHNMSSAVEDARNALPKPTDQCERLAKCLRHGVGFHHAGLHSTQRDIVEECFRAGKVKVICATPTLAAGVDLPAFRAVIRDLKRFSGRGLSWIPVLEYLQMAGRAGRPKYDSFGEAIVVCNTAAECDAVMEKYVRG